MYSISPSSLLSLVFGAVGAQETPDGWEFDRMTDYLKNDVFGHTKERFPDLHDRYFHRNCFTDSGIMLDMLTDAPTVTVGIGPIAPANGSDDLSVTFLVNDEIVRDVRKPGDVLLSLPRPGVRADGMNRVTVMLPYFARAAVRSVCVTEGCTVRPMPKRGLWLMHGDSITHGCHASSPALTYTGLIARHSDMECVNLGNGGYVHDPALVDSVPARPCDMGGPDRVPDVITVAYGINDLGRKTPERNRADMEAFYDALTARYPTSRIFMISPIWARMMGTGELPPAFAAMYAAFRETAVRYPGHVTYVDGLTLMPHELRCLRDDGVHPSDAGFAPYAENLLKIVEKSEIFLISV